MPGWLAAARYVLVAAAAGFLTGIGWPAVWGARGAIIGACLAIGVLGLLAIERRTGRVADPSEVCVTALATAVLCALMLLAHVRLVSDLRHPLAEIMSVSPPRLGDAASSACIALAYALPCVTAAAGRRVRHRTILLMATAAVLGAVARGCADDIKTMPLFAPFYIVLGTGPFVSLWMLVTWWLGPGWRMAPRSVCGEAE